MGDGPPRDLRARAGADEPEYVNDQPAGLRLAGEVGLEIVDIDDAAANVREFIAAITSAK